MAIKINDAIVRIRRLAEDHEQPFFFMLIGVQGCGKSTFSKFLIDEAQELGEIVTLASTDKQIDQEAAHLKITYGEAFKKTNFKQLKRQMNEDVSSAINNGHWIIWDQTNCAKNSRRKKLATIPDSYIKVGITFNVDDKVLKERLMLRAQNSGKVIPQHVLEDFQRRYETPTKEEGFNHLFEIDNN